VVFGTVPYLLIKSSGKLYFGLRIFSRPIVDLRKYSSPKQSVSIDSISIYTILIKPI
jgi:hypothetical protein